jgi:hypothetical protein
MLAAAAAMHYLGQRIVPAGQWLTLQQFMGDLSSPGPEAYPPAGSPAVTVPVIDTVHDARPRTRIERALSGQDQLLIRPVAAHLPQRVKRDAALAGRRIRADEQDRSRSQVTGPWFWHIPGHARLQPLPANHLPARRRITPQSSRHDLAPEDLRGQAQPCRITPHDRILRPSVSVVAT